MVRIGKSRDAQQAKGNQIAVAQTVERTCRLDLATSKDEDEDEGYDTTPQQAGAC